MVGSIDPRCETVRGTHWPKKGRVVDWSSRRGSHLGQRFKPPHQQAGHMDASDPIRPQKLLAARGPSTYGSRLALCLAGTTMKLNLRVWENPWRLMVAVNVAVLIGVFLYKITLTPYVPYIHLLVDYHFGFTKRALIGAIASLFADKMPVWPVFALGGAALLITAGLFVQLFRRTFGFDRAHMPLFVFTAGSPFFLKNFIYTLGHFDIYGCAIAIWLLLVPARSVAFVIAAALASMVLILV